MRLCARFQVWSRLLASQPRTRSAHHVCDPLSLTSHQRLVRTCLHVERSQPRDEVPMLRLCASGMYVLLKACGVNYTVIPISVPPVVITLRSEE